MSDCITFYVFFLLLLAIFKTYNSQMKNILMIFDVPFPFVKGGGQRRLYEVGRNLSKSGYKVSWLTFNAWDQKKSTIFENNITYIGTRKVPPLYNSKGNRNKSEPIIFLFDILKNTLKIRKYDYVWVAQWPLVHLIPLIFFSKIFGTKLIIDWWEVWSFKNWTSYSIIAGFIGYCVQQSTLFFIRILNIKVVTDNSLDYKKLLPHIKNPKLLLNISNGVPKDEIEKANLQFSSEYFDVVSLGRLKNHKGIDYLIKSIKILKEKYNLIGDGPEKDNLVELANKLNIIENITFFGEVESLSNVYGIMKNSGVLALTTHNGGGGNLTLLEAYGCGLPAVAFKVDEGIDEDLIDIGKTGFFVESVDAHSLADGIKKITENKETLSKMKDYALKKSEHLSWENTTNSYDNFFKS